MKFYKNENFWIVVLGVPCGIWLGLFFAEYIIIPIMELIQKGV
jgi:nitrogen fixation/metabolism regulation signal transduction histidine kinase